MIWAHLYMLICFSIKTHASHYYFWVCFGLCFTVTKLYLTKWVDSQLADVLWQQVSAELQVKAANRLVIFLRCAGFTYLNLMSICSACCMSTVLCDHIWQSIMWKTTDCTHQSLFMGLFDYVFVWWQCNAILHTLRVLVVHVFRN